MNWWTTEQVAEYLDVTPQAVYDSRARKRFPGNLGRQRGRRLLFPSEAIEAGRDAVEQGRDPDTPESTKDINTAILWTLQGIERKLGKILTELRAQRPQWIELVTEETIEVDITEEEE